MAADSDYLDDPVAAYDRVAVVFGAIAKRRRAYLDAVDALVIGGIPAGSHSLLDVGSGDGTRARRIAKAAGVERLTLLEPSAAMRSEPQAGDELWAIRAEALDGQQARFDVITCLWNVLGHIFPATARLETLRQFARLVSTRGRVFIDVNHRYNARHYGVLPTAARALRDRLFPAETNGDVRVAWDVHGQPCVTPGHVFTHREFSSLAHAAGLRIEKRFVVDYESGATCPWACHGHLLYVLRPS